MNIEELQSAWAGYNKRIESAAILNHTLVESMIRERSVSRISRIKNESRLLCLLMVLELMLLIAIIVGNPFEFVYAWQYIPFVLLAGAALVAVWSLARTINNSGTELTQVDLAAFLRQTIDAYDNNKRSHSRFVAILFGAGTLTAFSFLPRKLLTKDWWPAIGETFLMIGVSVLIYYAAHRSGAFRSRNKPGFENDLRELTQLRSLAADLSEPAKKS